MGWGEVVSTQMAQIKRTNNSELTKQQTLNIKMQNLTREIRDFFLIQFSCLCYKEKRRTILKHKTGLIANVSVSKNLSSLLTN